MEFEKSLLLIILTLTLWTAMALMLDRRGYARINRYFALLLLSFCVPQAYFYSRSLVPPEGIFFLALASQAVIWVKGPLLLTMVRLLVGRSVDGVWRHFAPFVVCLISLIIWPQWIFEWGLSGLVHALIYIVVALRCLQQHRQRLLVIYRGYKNSSFYWLLLVILGLLLVMAIDAVLIGWAYLYRSFLVGAINGAMWAISAYLLTIAFFSLYRPTLFFHQDRLRNASDVIVHDTFINNPEEATGSGNATEKAGGTSVNANDPIPGCGAEPAPVAGTRSGRELDASLAHTLAAQLETLMVRDQLYLEHNLSLGGLAERLGITIHQTSELLNVHMGVTYYDYLNRFRLQHACKMLRNPNCHLRILDIAFESGFGNKNSFHRCFLQTYGVTPSAYRNADIQAELPEVS